MQTPAQHRRSQAKFQKKPSEVKKRVARNAARRKMMRAGLVHKGDGKDVDHKRGIGAGNGRKNLRVQSRTNNRSFARTSKSKVKRYG